MDKMREEFEAWCDEQGFASDKYGADDCGDTYKHLVGEYVISDTRLLWDGWQASRASLCVQMPRCWNDEQRDYRDNMLDSLDDAGVRHE